MSLSGYFEDFGSQPTASAGNAPVSDSVLEDERLKSFEVGYSAGWDDAIKAQSDTGTQVTEDLRQALADFDFTLHEATGQFSELIAPNLIEIFNKILPEIAQSSLPFHILEEMKPLISASPEDHLTVRVSPQNASVVKKLIEGDPEIKADVSADDMIGPAQANISVSMAEREIDLQDLSDKILTAVNALFQSLRER